jgi:hypothetical protein
MKDGKHQDGRKIDRTKDTDDLTALISLVIGFVIGIAICFKYG